MMDDYEFSKVKPLRRKKKPGRVWNVLTILVLIVTLCIALGFLVIYINPYNILNPFPPPPIHPTATASVTPRFTIVPSWTATSIVIKPTDTPAPTHTPLVTPSNTPNPVNVQANILEANTDYAFEVQQGSPSAIDGTQFHPDTGCEWTGIAGQASSLNGEAVKGLFVQLGGSLPGTENVDNLTMTGMAPQYGQGGFEITLSDKLIDSSGALWIQLLDQQNLPLSDRIYFNTYDDCAKNLIIIYFTQVH